jgi:hypothetical protein
MSFSKQFLHGRLDILKPGLVQWLTRQQDDIPTRRQRTTKRLDGRPKAALAPVALDCATDGPASNHCDVGWFEAGRQFALRPWILNVLPGNDQHSKRVGIRLTRVPHPLDFCRPRQTKLSFHPRPCFGKDLISCRLPADALDVIVHGNRQLMPATQAAALDHVASILGRHTLAKSMHSQAAMNLRLISAFNHLLNILSILHIRRFIIHYLYFFDPRIFK